MQKKATFLLVFLSIPWAGFLEAGGFELQSDPLTLAAYLDRDAVHPGETFRVAVVLSMEKGWHAYANPKGPGTGKETVVRGKSTAGFRFLQVRYLPGKRVNQVEIGPDDWVYAYEGEVPVFLEVEASADLKPGKYNLEIEVDALVCKESCLPVLTTVKVPVEVVSPGKPTKPANQKWFKDFAKAKAAPGAPPPESPPAKKTAPPETESFDFSRYKARELEQPVTGLLMALVFGFIAGVILNVMPCVLPVISIKIFSLVAQAHQERSRIFKLGLAFAGGIVFVFAVLAALAALMGYSWGQHFQNETFLIVMIAVMFVFALGLFDVYIILVPGAVEAGGGEGYLGSFFKGVLTTFLATPCSGPFLGATLAWALTQRPVVIFTVFASIGVGMAAPYLVLSAFPGLLRFVPKPGAWMETFKHLMGFLLLGTVVYLFSLLRRDLMVPTLIFILLLGFLAYLWGRFAHGGVPFAKRWAIRAALLVLAFLSAWYSYRSRPEPIKWEPFSVAALERYSGRTGEPPRNLVIKFTADWCINCKVVERFVLENPRVLEAFRRKGAVLMKADFTHARPNDAAQRFMAQLGSRSIPFLAIFPADDPFHPYVLRDLYGTGQVLDIVKRLPEPLEGTAEKRIGGEESAGG